MRRLLTWKIAGPSVLLFLIANAIAGYLYFPNATKKSYSKAVFDEKGRLLRAFITPDEKWRFAIDDEALTDDFVSQLLCLEDQRFWQHPGVDVVALTRAMYQNAKAGRVVSGGSTITMQMVRLLKPKERNIWNKAVEAWAAVIAETFLSKEDILKQYLSYAPYGSNIEGVEAAAYRYFKKRVNQLDAKEASFLFLLHQTPARLFRYSTQEWQDKLKLSLNRLAECEAISQEEADRLAKQKFKLRTFDFPSLAPHFAEEVANQSRNLNHTTTLNIHMQKTLEDKVATVKNNYMRKGVHNVSIIVAEHETGKVKALIGNFDYNNQNHSQQINSTRAHRSYGSTLKPFLYGMGIEEGKILPDGLVEDVPVSYQHYRPQNYSGSFTGLVTAEYALSQSLNVPFVRLLERVGLHYFLERLSIAGVKFRQQVSDMGLSIIIGGAELTPWDVTQLYTSLAREGEVITLRHNPKEKSKTYPLLKPASTFLVNRALTKRDRPDYPSRSEFAIPKVKVRWKTGTSQGRRDAWSVGVGPKYVVSVWMGNLDRESSPHLTGSKAAAPLMFDILSMFEHKPKVERFPEDLVEVRVCAFSGLVAQSHCPHHKRVMAYQKRVPAEKCPYHKRIMVHEQTNLRVGPQCRSKVGDVSSKVVLHFPPKVRAWLDPSIRAEAMDYKLHPLCENNTAVASNLAIRLPKDGQKFMLLPSQKMDQLRLPVMLESSFPLNKITCFLNGKQMSGGDLMDNGFIEVRKGSHNLHCIDPTGKARTNAFYVL